MDQLIKPNPCRQSAGGSPILFGVVLAGGVCRREVFRMADGGRANLRHLPFTLRVKKANSYQFPEQRQLEHEYPTNPPPQKSVHREHYTELMDEV